MTAQDTRVRGQGLLEEEIGRRGAQIVLESEGQRRRMRVTSSWGAVSARFSVRSGGDWQTKYTEGDPSAVDDEARAWIFVDISDERSPRFYIATEAAIKRDIAVKYDTYLREHGGRRPKNPDSTHYGITTEHVAQWLDRWDLLGLA